MPADVPPIARTIKDWTGPSGCGLGKTKIYQLIDRGELAVCRVDNRTVILTEDMEACLKRHRQFRGGNGSVPPANTQKTGKPPKAPKLPPAAPPERPANSPGRRGRRLKSPARSPP